MLGEFDPDALWAARIIQKLWRWRLRAQESAEHRRLDPNMFEVHAAPVKVGMLPLDPHRNPGVHSQC